MKCDTFPPYNEQTGMRVLSGNILFSRRRKTKFPKLSFLYGNRIWETMFIMRPAPPQYFVRLNDKGITSADTRQQTETDYIRITLGITNSLQQLDTLRWYNFGENMKLFRFFRGCGVYCKVEEIQGLLNCKSISDWWGRAAPGCCKKLSSEKTWREFAESC